jgi:ABC-type sugar transport system ATPase subunit
VPAADGIGQVRVIERLGVESLVAVAMPFGDITARTAADTALEPDMRVNVELTPAEIHVFSLKTGERLETAVAVAR